MGRWPNVVHALVNALDDKKASNINVKYIRNDTKKAIADYEIIATARNERMLGALSDVVVEVLEKYDRPIHHIEGKKARSTWILVDAFTIIVHLFTKDARAEYNLEGLYEEK